MIVIDIAIIVMIVSLLFNTTVTDNSCKSRNSLFSQENNEKTCSLYIWEDKDCLQSMSSFLGVSEESGNCSFHHDSYKQRLCKKGRTCHMQENNTQFCHCVEDCAGQFFENRNTKTAHKVTYDNEVIMFHHSRVTFEVLHKVDNVELQTGENYYTSISDHKSFCKGNNCTYRYEGFVQYPYKPHINRGDLGFLEKHGVGYFTVLSVNAVYEGVYVYKNTFKVFVKYPENIKCMPLVEVEGCGISYDKSTLYSRKTEITLVSRILSVSDGYSHQPSTPNTSCKNDSDFKRLWKVEKLRSKTGNISKKMDNGTSMTFQPFELDFGRYNIYLEVKGGNNYKLMNFATCYIEIASLPLEAVVTGGDKRRVLKKDGLVLIAEQSRDPNQPLSAQSITAKWSCSSNMSQTKACKQKILNATLPYYISPTELSEGEYIFKLEIWSDRYNSCQPATLCEEVNNHQYTYQSVTVVDQINLSILCQRNCGKKVMTTTELVLKAKYKNSFGLSYEWMCMMSDNTIIRWVPRNNLPPYIFFVPEGTLKGAANYTVIASVTVNNESLSTAYSFETDSFIYSGSCSVKPDHGIRGLSRFDISCSKPKSDDVTFEFYDKTSQEVKDTVFLSGRILGISKSGQLQGVILSRGTVVIQIINSRGLYVKKVFEIELKDKEFEDSVLLDKLMNALSSSRFAYSSNFLQYVSYIFDILTPKHKKTDEALQTVILTMSVASLKNSNDVKISSLTLYNLLLKLKERKFGFVEGKSARNLILKQLDVLVRTINKKNIPNIETSRVLKGVIQVLFNSLELTLYCEDMSQDENTSGYVSSLSYLKELEVFRMLDIYSKVVTGVLSKVQQSGISPTIISSNNNTIVTSVLKVNSEYNYITPKMLSVYSDIPVKFSSVLMQRLENNIKSKSCLSIAVTIINRNISKLTFNKEDRSMTNLLSVTIFRRAENGTISSIGNLPSPLDIEINSTNVGSTIEKPSRLFKLDSNLHKENVINIHRFEPKKGSLMFITFLFPPTNTSLRVLIVENLRPTHEMMMTRSRLITAETPHYSPTYVRLKGRTYYYMGVLPGPGAPVNQSVVYSFTAKGSTCKSWQTFRWKSVGCRIRPISKEDKIHCQCTQLSMYSVLFYIVPNKFNPFHDVELVLRVVDHPMVVIVMAGVLIIYINLLMWAYHKM